MRVVSLLCVSILAVACDAPTQPAPVARPPIVPSIPSSELRIIEVGETVQDRLTDFVKVSRFQLTATADGTLVIKVNWDRKSGRLELVHVNRTFYGDEVESIVARIPVAARDIYSFEVSYCCPWDYGIDTPFVLSTAIE